MITGGLVKYPFAEKCHIFDVISGAAGGQNQSRREAQAVGAAAI
jgi:hypothetical protein